MKWWQRNKQSHKYINHVGWYYPSVRSDDTKRILHILIRKLYKKKEVEKKKEFHFIKEQKYICTEPAGLFCTEWQPTWIGLKKVTPEIW